MLLTEGSGDKRCLGLEVAAGGKLLEMQAVTTPSQNMAALGDPAGLTRPSPELPSADWPVVGQFEFPTYCVTT